jgi:hypothetical protein
VGVHACRCCSCILGLGLCMRRGDRRSLMRELRRRSGSFRCKSLHSRSRLRARGRCIWVRCRLARWLLRRICEGRVRLFDYKGREKVFILGDFEGELVDVSEGFCLCYEVSVLYVGWIGELTFTPISIPAGAP